MSTISKFNPQEMDLATVEALATGRTQLLQTVWHTVEQNLYDENVPQHILLVGPRGMGKTFFLRYLELHINKQNKERREKNEYIEQLVFPEDPTNIVYSADFLQMIINHLTGKKSAIRKKFEESENEWEEKKQELEKIIKKRKTTYKKYLLLLPVENFDIFLNKDGAFKSKTNQGKFRAWMQESNNIMLICATLNTDLDKKYKARLFHAFSKYELSPWREIDYITYFRKRKKLKALEDKVFEENKLKAISKYTGGSPRMAVVLSDLLLEERTWDTIQTLFGIIDDLTPFYQDLLDKVPTRSQVLFDTLIKAGENLSQTELSEMLETTQSKIAQAFKWLSNRDYVRGLKKDRIYKYYVPDRLFVLYYQRRHIYNNENYNPILLLSDFLCSFYTLKEIKEQAYLYFERGENIKGKDMTKLYFKSVGIKREEIVNYLKDDELLFFLKKIDKEEKEKFKELERDYKADVKSLGKRRDIDVSPRKLLKELLEELKHFDKYANVLSGKDFAKLLEESLSLDFNEKIRVADFLLNNNSSKQQYVELVKIFKEEKEKFKELEKGYLIDIIKIRLKNEKPKKILKEIEEKIKNCSKKEDLQELYLSKAFILTILNKKELAAENFNKAKAIKTNNENLYSNLGHALSSIGNNKEALKAYNEALTINPKDDKVYTNLGYVLSSLERKEEALEAYKKAININPKNDKAYTNLGYVLNSLERKEEAIEAHKKAIEINPNDDQTYYNLGYVLDSLERKEEALEAYGKAININPKNDKAYTNLGNVLDDLERKEEAIEAYGKAIDINPNNEIAYQNLGNVLDDLERKEEAIEAYKKAIGINPKNERTYINLGNVLDDLERKEEAIEAYKKAIGINPKNDKAYTNLGYVLSSLERKEEALEAYKKAIGINPKNDKAYTNLGNVLDDLERKEEALEAYEKSIAINPNKPITYNNRGYTLAKLERYEEALSSYKTSLSLAKKQNNIEHQKFMEGNIVGLYFIMGKQAKAWEIIENTSFKKEEVFIGFADAVLLKQIHQGRASAFEIAVHIFEGLLSRKNQIDIYDALKNFFSVLIREKLPIKTLKDILFTAQKLFPKKNNTILFDAILHIVEYLQEKRNEKYLTELNPDVAILVRAIADDIEYW